MPELIRGCEGQLYHYCFPFDKQAIDLIVNTLSGTNSMHFRNGIRLKCQGRRMSGDMCTSLGNTFTNYMLFRFWAYCHGLSDGQFNALVEGDDGLFAVPSEIDLDAEFYKKLGFTIEIVNTDDPSLASFCKLIYSDDGTIVRDPYRFISKFAWTHSNILAGDRIMDELLRAKALSAVYESPSCPIVGAIARYALAHTRHVRPRFEYDGYHSCPSDEVTVIDFAPSDSARKLFSDLFAICPAEQIAIESFITEGDFDSANVLLWAGAFRHNSQSATDRLWFNQRFVVVV